MLKKLAKFHTQLLRIYLPISTHNLPYNERMSVLMLQ